MGNSTLVMKGIKKEFPGVKALMGADFDLQAGEVHALLGINGAGKSTLIKILAGIYPKDSGEILIDGQKVEISSPLSAKSLGISTVYQDPQVIPSFTGYENIFLGSETEQKSIFSAINRRKLRKQAQKLLEKYPFHIDLNRPVFELEAVEKETIAVLRALSQQNTRILVLDEPTSILTRKEILILFQQIELLKTKGISIIYITHRLDEVFQIADRFTILRDGMNVGTFQVKEKGIDNNKITELMLGEKLTQVYPQHDTHPADELLRVEQLSYAGKYRNINFSAHRGEIVGLFGLVGSGFDELCKSLFGYISPNRGKIFVSGKEVHLDSVQKSIQNGIFLIPGDRRSEGQISDENVAFNTTLSALDKISGLFGLIRGRKERQDSEEIVDRLKIKTPDIFQKVSLLSGGNQQKVVIGKGLYTQSNVYIFEEPTIGVDVGAKSSIYRLIKNLSSEKAVIVASSDCEEVYGICDRILVLYKGEIVINKPVQETRLDEMLLFGLTGGKNA